MITKIIHAKIHRMHFRDNQSFHGIARKTGLSRSTVKKWIHVPISSQIKFHRTPPEKKIKPFESGLLQSLKSDSLLPKHDQRTVKELFNEIQEQGFSGCYSCVTRFVQNWRQNSDSAATTPITHASSEEMLHWMRWLYSLEQPHRAPTCEESLVSGLKRTYDVLVPSPNAPRTKVLAILAKIEGFSAHQIAQNLGISRSSVRRYLAAFQAGGESELFKGKSKQRKSDNQELKNSIFALLHEPPSLHNINRTTWKLSDVREILKGQGHSAGPRTISKIIKDAGYRWRTAKTVLTSTDPEYREKYQHIQDILSESPPIH